MGKVTFTTIYHLMRIGLLLSVLLLWAQTLLAQATVAVAAKDSLDIFKEGAPTSVLEAYNALWNDAAHKSFWNEFQQKFAADFDAKKQSELLFSQNIDIREIDLFNQRRKQQEFLKNHPDAAKLSEPFKRYVENTIR